jgi:hypothetical protein
MSWNPSESTGRLYREENPLKAKLGSIERFSGFICSALGTLSSHAVVMFVYGDRHSSRREARILLGDCEVAEKQRDTY